METLVLGIELDLPQTEIDGLADSTAGIADGMASNLSGASKGLQELGKRSTQGTRAITGLASAVSLVDPKLGQVVRTVGTLGRGLQVFRLGLGPAAIAVGALTAALAVWRHETERAAREQEEAEERVQDFTDALDAQSVIAQDLRDDIRLLNGEVSKTGLAAEKRKEQIQTAGDEVVRTIDAEIAALEELKRVEVEERGGLIRNREEVERLTAAIAEQTQEREDAVEATESQLEAVDFLVMEGEALEDLEAGKREADREERERQRRAREAAREAARRARDRQRELEELGRMRDDLAGIEERAAQSGESGADRILRAQAEQVSSIDAIVEAHYADADALAAVAGTHAEVVAAIEAETLAQQVASDAGQAKAAVAMETEHALTELRSESIATLEAQAEAAHQRELARADEERQVRLDSLNSIAGGMGSLADLAMSNAQRLAETDKKAAQAALERSKKLATAEATVSLGSGILNASARLAGRPIATGIAVAGLLATYATQVAAIQSATLHQGGFGVAPDEYRAQDGTTRLREERVVSPTGSRQEEELRQIERGGGSGGVVMVPVYKHFGRFSRDEIRRQGALGNALRANAPRTGPGRY